ncbi:MAG: hypothetical protein KGZ88_01700 [Methylomicrobium sp.]|nr:hypothetical protein [Methylomicrobium sp.]PPD24126.1 MAG: hypothetical protein CTY24_02035 [Methylobacter sp.]
MPTLTSADISGLENKLGGAEIKFIDVLNALPDTRDNRGKRHSLTFLVSTVVFYHLGWALKSIQYLPLLDE